VYCANVPSNMAPMIIAGNPESVEKLQAFLVMFPKARDVITTNKSINLEQG
jgi:hypothetical protein